MMGLGQLLGLGAPGSDFDLFGGQQSLGFGGSTMPKVDVFNGQQPSLQSLGYTGPSLQQLTDNLPTIAAPKPSLGQRLGQGLAGAFQAAGRMPDPGVDLTPQQPVQFGHQGLMAMLQRLGIM